jgi:sugar phosphate isomerase/epimerase
LVGRFGGGGFLAEMATLGISTAWKSEVWTDGRAIIEAILGLGIQAVELDYRLTLRMAEQILPLWASGRFSVISVHNYFPVPDGVPAPKGSWDFFSLSSPDDEERKRAVQYTIHTMEWAQRLRARAVVVHLGKISMENPMPNLRRLYDEGKIQTEEGQAFIAEQERIREVQARVYLEAALRSLEQAGREAEKRGLLLGIENRYNLQDFPNPKEFKVLFRELSGGAIRYWHDVGHATALENLGLVKRKELLENFGPLLLGTHLHGCRGYHDHEVPGSGEEDYLLLKRYLKHETLRIVETHHRTPPAEMIKGIALLGTQGII